MDRRPINQGLFTLDYPITAYISILHRITGLILCLAIPIGLWLLQESLASISRFTTLQQTLERPSVRGILWISFLALGFHLIAGIRHLLMDCHIGESKAGGRLSSYLVLIA